MASTAVSSLAHNNLMPAKTRTHYTRTRQTSVKYQLSDDDDEDDDEPNSTQGSTGSAGSWYKVERIIGEKKGKYKILWEGVDPKTNKPWPADWINKSQITAPAIAEWEEFKRAKAASKVTGRGRPPLSKKRTWADSTAEQGIKVKRIQFLVHDRRNSDSDYQPTQPLTDPIVDSSPVRPPQRPIRKRGRSAFEDEDEDEIEDSLEQGLPGTPYIVSGEPFVELSQKSASFDRTEYLQFSDLASSVPSSQNSNWGQGASQDSASAPQLPLFKTNTRKFDIDQVIPDSQPSYSSSAYVSLTVEIEEAEPEVGPEPKVGFIAIENNLNKENNEQAEEEEEEDNSDPLLAEGAQPRSQWYGGANILGENFTDYLGPLLQGDSLSIRDPFTQLQGWEPGPVLTQDEYRPLTFASHPAELDTPADSSILEPPSRSPSLYAGFSDDDFPPISLSNSLMAEQQSFRTPPPAGSQTPSTGRPSLRERLAQARLGFNDAVSAFRSTPAPADTPTPSGRASPPPMSSQVPIATSTPQDTPPLKPISQSTSVVVNDIQAGSKNSNTIPRHEKEPLPNYIDTQSQSDPLPLIQSHPTNFASQLQLSLSSLPEIDKGYIPSQAALSQFSSYESLPSKPKLSRGEYVVLVGLSTGQQEAYLQNINNKSRIIQKYCNGELQDDLQAEKEIFGLLGTARRIATHLDLTTDEALNWEKQELGYALLHPKFKFLKAFFDAIRYQSLSIAILAEAGKTLDILELFLKALKLRCRRTDGFNTVPTLASNEINGSVNVLLAPTGIEGARVLGSHTSLVIGLDSTFSVEDKQVKTFRAHSLEVGRDAPILKLVAINTVEHVKLFLPSQSKHYLPQLMSYVAILRQQAGNLPETYTSGIDPTGIAKAIVESTESEVEIPLKTPDIPELSIYDNDGQSYTQKNVVTLPAEDNESLNLPAVPNVSTNESENGTVPSIAHAGEKRRWEETSQEIQVAGSEELPEKKRKVVNGMPTSSEDTEITHISDTQPNISQDRRSSMDIDQPEQAAAKGSSLPQIQSPLPPRPPPVVPTLVQERTGLDSEDSIISLAIREHENEEAQAIEGQIVDIRTSGLMEEVAYDRPEEQMETALEDQPAIENAGTEAGLVVPIALSKKISEPNRMTDTGNGNKLNPSARLEPEPEPEPESNLLEGVVDTEIEACEENEYDGFKFPLFEMPSKLPSGSALMDLGPDELRSLLFMKNQELNQWVKSTSRLQRRYEEMREETKSIKSELRKATRLDVHTKERMTRLNTEVVQLKDERKALRQELQEARAALLDSGKPDLVKMEEFRSQNAKMKDELATIRRQLENTKSEAAYALNAYQTATREGGDRSKEAEELRRLNEELKRKADERAIKLRELQYENQTKVKDQQVDKLKHLLAEREERIRRLELERNSIGYKGGRPLGTRATSVPRRGSPSTSRTSSPGPGALPGVSTIQAPVGRDHHSSRSLHIQNATRRGNKE